MEAILIDVKRALRSLLGMAHADSGAHKRNGVEMGRHGVANYRSFGDLQKNRDVYGRLGRSDIFSSREVVEFYKKMAYFDSHVA
jgi:hypothetical protein